MFYATDTSLNSSSETNNNTFYGNYIEFKLKFFLKSQYV